MGTSKNLLCGSIVALHQRYAIRYPASRMRNCRHGTRSVAYQTDMSPSLRAVRLALAPLATIFRGAQA